MKKSISAAVLAAFVLVLASCGTPTTEQTTPATDSCAVKCDTACAETCTVTSTVAATPTAVVVETATVKE